MLHKNTNPQNTLYSRTKIMSCFIGENLKLLAMQKYMIFFLSFHLIMFSFSHTSCMIITTLKIQNEKENV